MTIDQDRELHEELGTKLEIAKGIMEDKNIIHKEPM